MGTGEASRQSLSQSPVLGRHGNKQRGAGGWGTGARERQTGAKLSLIWLHAATMTPALWDPVCFTGQWTQSLFSSPVPLTQTGSTPLKHTHTHTPSHTPHSPSHTYSLSLTHTHTQAQSLQELRHRKHGDPGAVLTHQAHGACGNSPESQLSSVI